MNQEKSRITSRLPKSDKTAPVPHSALVPRASRLQVSSPMAPAAS